MNLAQSPGYKTILQWLQTNQRQPFAFQQQTWQHIINNKSGLVNAPTGCGKTYSVFLGAIIQFINAHPEDYFSKKNNGLQLLWITPLRALAKDIARAMEEVIAGLSMSWNIGIRNGDTQIKERERQKKQMPEVLIITPESLHLLLAQKNNPAIFSSLRIIAVDEWHELLGSKRGVQTELAISRMVNIKYRICNSECLLWGISATIGNLEEAKEVLLSSVKDNGIIIKADLYKKTEIQSIFPDEIEKYPWAGHLGIKLVDKILPIINSSRTTLIFINTRGMTEMWYQALLSAAPELAGAVALHHGSIEQELRFWVEENLHTGKLKAVVCTASLDLGVDFRPVETVIQVGSPKGVSRFLQRAGRSGHSPDAVSKIYFLPTHSLELVEAAALKQAVQENFIESKIPLLLCFDVLIQYLCTLAVGEGFYADEMYKEIKSTYCFAAITEDEYKELLLHITAGGKALNQYDEYKKVEIMEDGLYKINSRRTAMRHRLHIGTIVSDSMLKVKFFSGGYIGVIEEYFISRLAPGDSFTIAGRNLELVMIKDMTVLVKKSTSKKSIIPSWQGGRMSLSSNLGKKLRQSLDASQHTNNKTPELKILKPLFDLQNQLSKVPLQNELLIEHIETKDGFHLFVYPFEGRLVHEAMAAILAYRISKITPITFSFAMNDYGFELLSDQPIPLDDSNVYELFTDENLFADIQRSVNSTEMAKRKFRDIAVIGGLIFQGMPGEKQKARHLQSSASLLFKVFAEYEPDNILLKQAYGEVFEQQMEETRLRDMLQRIQKSKIVITWPQQLTPFCFPLKVDSIRENVSSEKLEDRVKRMQQQLTKNTE
jgi:ATP-dependent helicase Lhr and Lhr-like helicase